MMLVFLIDQTQWLCCAVYQQAKEKAQRFAKLWETFRGLMTHFEIDSWETRLRASETSSATRYRIRADVQGGVWGVQGVKESLADRVRRG